MTCTNCGRETCPRPAADVAWHNAETGDGEEWITRLIAEADCERAKSARLEGELEEARGHVVQALAALKDAASTAERDAAIIAAMERSGVRRDIHAAVAMQRDAATQRAEKAERALAAATAPAKVTNDEDACEVCSCGPNDTATLYSDGKNTICADCAAREYLTPAPAEVARVTLRGTVNNVHGEIASIDLDDGNRTKLPLPGATIGEAVTLEVRKG